MWACITWRSCSDQHRHLLNPALCGVLLINVHCSKTNERFLPRFSIPSRQMDKCHCEDRCINPAPPQSVEHYSALVLSSTTCCHMDVYARSSLEVIFLAILGMMEWERRQKTWAQRSCICNQHIEIKYHSPHIFAYHSHKLNPSMNFTLSMEQ